MVSPLLPIFHQPPGASCGALCGAGVSAFSTGSCGGGVLKLHHSPGVPLETEWHSVLDFECGGAVSSLPLRIQPRLTSSPVRSGALECPGGFARSPFSGPRLRVNLVSGGLPRTSPVTCHHRSLATSLNHRLVVYFAPLMDPQSAGTDGMLQSWDGLCLPSLQPHLAGSGEGSAISGVGADSGGSVLASAPLVSGSFGASGGSSFLPAMKEGFSQTTAFPSLPPEPPCASTDCMSYLQLSAWHSGFSAVVACQLAHCRRRSTRVNYQAKWTVYRVWCRRNGHSVSRPTVPKVADFLLYLRRSLSLSYSSIASYCSMLSGVFRFVLPELSSHFVLHDLLGSFRLERPLSSSRVPPWDLLAVLRF